MESGTTQIINDGKPVQVEIFGKHNLQNLAAAQKLCAQLGVDKNSFYNLVADFKGAARRLQTVYKSEDAAVFYDFAHAPSKVTASTNAVKDLWPDKKLIVVFELHTFSSLNKDFIGEYKASLNSADEVIIYYNKHTFEIKKLPILAEADVRNAFNHNNLSVINDREKLEELFNSMQLKNENLLLMTSGNFSGLKPDDIVTFVTK